MARNLTTVVQLLQLKRFTKAYNLSYIHTEVKPKKTLNPLRKISRRHDDPNELKIAKRICVSVLGNNAVGQPRCLCVFTEFKCYLFNCGEGSRRIAMDHNVDLKLSKHVFITEAKWENLSGLPDVYLTRNTYGFRRITLHGPPNIECFIDTVKANKKSVIIYKRSLDQSPYSDDTLEVESIPIYKMKGRRKGALLANNNQNVTGNDAYRVVCYICRVKSRPGELSPEKCVAHGVPVGPLLLKLKNGEDIILSSGKLVCSKDVHNESQEGCNFLVVDCPYEELIETFVKEKKLHQFDSYAVFHFSPPHVINSFLYQRWMSGFSSSTLHIVLNSHNSPVSSEAIHELQHVLHMFHPRIFPLLHNKHIFPHTDSGTNLIQAEPRLQLHLRPQKVLDWSNVVRLNPANFIEQAHEVPGFSNSLKLLHEAICATEADVAQKGRFLDDYPEVIFLGTSSSTSVAYRNVSGILVHIDVNSSILLDCGEGTYMQLVRYFGPDKIESELRKITCIFISHHHSDHCMGLFHVIKARQDAFSLNPSQYKPVSVVTSYIVADSIRKYNRIFGPIYKDISLYLCNQLIEDCCFTDPLKESSTPIQVQPVPVVHCTESYGVVLQAENWKIVYSGDACPSQALIDEGQNCNMLIHEATVEDNLLLEAIQNKHSTPSQVIEVAEKMNAEHVILTHFSRRYLVVPVFAESRDVGCAFDYMTVRLCDLPLLPLFVPTLKILFSELLHKYATKSASTGSLEKLFFKNLSIDIQSNHALKCSSTPV